MGMTGEAVYEVFDIGTFDLNGSQIDIIPDFNAQTVILVNSPLARNAACGGLRIDAQAGSVPTIGQTTVINFSGIPVNAASTALLLGTATTGGGISLDAIGMDGCTLYSNLNIPVPIPVTASQASLPISGNTSGVGLTFHTQGVSIAPGVNNLGVALSNLGTLTIGDTNPSVFEAVGSSSFNSNTSSGYWRIINNNLLDITSLTIDFAANGMAQAFDLDQAGMADRFDGGLSPTAGCSHTYRNNSHVTTGLVFAGSQLSAGCSSLETGWTGSNPTTPPTTYQTLTFNFSSFSPGDVFEFDADTDGGGSAGHAMAGTVITVTYIGGLTATGTMVAAGTNRAEALF